jgi:hypothetical protein
MENKKSGLLVVFFREQFVVKTDRSLGRSPPEQKAAISYSLPKEHEYEYGNSENLISSIIINASNNSIYA